MILERNPLSRRCASLRDRLLQAIELESSLAAKLREHEGALMRGEIDRIHGLNAELDAFLGSLKDLAHRLGDDAIDLAELLNLPSRTPLRESLGKLPSPSREELTALRQRLLLARRAAQCASSKNAAIARASLDAIHGVRELLGRAQSPTSVPVSESDSGRLDAHA
jgi:hypothetical protein